VISHRRRWRWGSFDNTIRVADFRPSSVSSTFHPSSGRTRPNARASSVPSVESSGKLQSRLLKEATKTLASYNLKLREETDLDTLTEEVLGVVRETMEPEHASLWLRPHAANAKEDSPA
jgi:hypothetical protein